MKNSLLTLALSASIQHFRLVKTFNILILCVFFIGLSPLAIARIGETEQKCGQLYGDVLLRQDEGGGVLKIGFAKGDVVVLARFMDGKAVSLTFSKFNDNDEEVAFTTEELDALLGDYGSRTDWRTVYSHEIRGKMLFNATHDLIANVGGNLKSIIISSKKFAVKSMKNNFPE